MLLQNKLCAKVYSVIRWSVVMKLVLLQVVNKL